MTGTLDAMPRCEYLDGSDQRIVIGQPYAAPDGNGALIYTCLVAGDSRKNLGGCPNANIGNPASSFSGNKYQLEEDLPASTFPIRRVYNSKQFPTENSGFGRGWTASFEQKIKRLSATEVEISRADGRAFKFFEVSGVFTPEADGKGRLIKQVGIGWMYFDDGHVDFFDAGGEFVQRRLSNGASVTLTFSNVDFYGPGSTPSRKLTKVSDHLGREFNLIYGATGFITRISGGGSFVDYSYDSARNLSARTISGVARTYIYDEPAYSSAPFAHALTGVVDESGNRFATYRYSADGKATSTEHSGGANAYSLSFGSSTSTTVTDPLGVSRAYSFEVSHGVKRLTGVSQPGGPGCGASSSAI
ncbi:MAG: RHS repeat protein, partial [Methyloversatilis discipulorum]|uniref:DUF6531 domain-containing protein n=1 Tax=Methyloversatilis discipulorum TaxID=1119528 RepID=UPI0026ED4A6E